MSHVEKLFLALTLLVVGLTACVSGRGSPDEPGPTARLPDDVEMAAKEALTAETGVDVGDMEVIEAKQREWSDACLGLADEGEMCAQVITPGWEVTLRAGGETYTLHTNEDGTAIRLRN